MLIASAWAMPWDFASRTALMVAPAKKLILQGKFLVVLEHPRPPASGRLAHFLHRERALPRLQVRDVHLRGRAHLAELLREDARAQVLGRRGDLVLLVGERRLDDEVLEMRRLV